MAAPMITEPALSKKALIKVISKLRVDAGFEWLLEDILNFMPVWIY